MSSLIISRRDLDFLLHEWLSVDQLAARPAYSDHSRETFDAALDLYERLATGLFAPHNKTNDQREPYLEEDHVRLIPEIGEALKAFASAGLLAAAHPVEQGGMGLPHVVERAGMAIMMAANCGSIGYAFLTQANANLLLAHGSPDQVGRCIRPMLEGRYLGTMCLSEPQAGSSLSDITTRAEPQPDGGFRLFGSKMWISGGEHELSENILHLVLAKIPAADGQLPGGSKGISLFLVPRRLLATDGSSGERNDIAVIGLNHKMGQRGTVNCALNLGDGKFKPGGRPGAIGELIGKPGTGLAYMFHMMNEARIAIGLEAAALGYTGYLHALDYARNRRQGRPLGTSAETKPVLIIEHTDVKRMLLAQKAYVEGGLALVLYCANLVDERDSAPDSSRRVEADRLLDLLTPIAKSWPSQWCLAANDLAIQVHGGYGYTRDYNVEQFYRDNRLNSIHEGTHGIQALDLLGRKVRQHDGESVQVMGRVVRRTIASARSHTSLAIYAEQLDAAWSRLTAVTDALNAVSDMGIRAANASAYLEAFGHIVVAWIWLEQALVATSVRVGLDKPDGGFYTGKRMACQYYFRWELPRVYTWLSVLDPVDRTCLDMKDSWY